MKRTGSVVEINDTGETKAGWLVEAGHPGGRNRLEDQDQSKLLPTLCARGSSLCHRYYAAQYFMLEWPVSCQGGWL